MVASGSSISAPSATSAVREGAPEPATVATITGVAMAVPARLISNREIAARLGVDEAWITKRTGTRERPWAEPVSG